jgi:AraC-like DNA-binding protein
MRIDIGVDDKVYSAVKIATVLDALASEGLPIDAAMQGLALTRAEIASPATRVSLAQVLAVCAAADRLSRDPHFAYHAGQRLHVSAYGMYGFAILSSMNFRRTMTFVMNYFQLATPLVELDFREAGGCGVWSFTPIETSGDSRLARFIIEMQFGVMTSLFRDVMGGAFTAREYHVTFAPPDDASEYPALLGGPVMFGLPENALRFDAGWLDGTPNLGNEITYRAVVQLCDSMIEELRLHAGVAGRLRRCLMTDLAHPAGFEAAANALGMSPRTLRRKLGEEKTSFRQVADELRMEMAIRYLRDTDLTVEDIADLIGFSDASNFRHAFRRWTKAAPSAFRDNRVAP